MRSSIVVTFLVAGALTVGVTAARDVDITEAGLKWTRVLSFDADSSADRISNVKRAKVPGGWLIHVRSGETTSSTFLPDPSHGWLKGGIRPRRTTPAPKTAAQPKSLAAPKRAPSYFATAGDVPTAERVNGLPWLRKRPGIAYAQLRRIPAAIHRKYQSFKQAYKLGQECGGEFTSLGFRINWMQKTSFLSQGLGLRVGDVLRSVNGKPFGHPAVELHAALRAERRFAILIQRKGRDLVLPFEVPRWLGEDR